MEQEIWQPGTVLLADKPFHRQDELSYCGAASAQVMLASLDGGQLYPQDYLERLILRNNTSDPMIPWSGAPDGLRWVLQRHQPTNDQAATFRIIETNCSDCLSRKIVWSVFNHKVPAAVLVFDMRHWVTVYGYQLETRTNPIGPNDHSYNIKAFFVRSSSAFVTYPQSPPPPHFEGDPCGERQGFGIKNHHVTYKTWQDVYDTGVPQDSGSRWGGKHIAVCYLEDFQISDDASESDQAHSLRRPYTSEPPVKFEDTGRRRVHATAGARKGLLDYGLDRRRPATRVLNGIHPWRGLFQSIKSKTIDFAEPVLVQIAPRLSHRYKPYYIVPMETSPALTDPAAIASHRRRPVLVIADAESGEYLESCSMPSREANAVVRTQWEDLKEAAENPPSGGTDNAQLGSLRRLLPSLGSSSFAKSEAQWEPCPECFSRFCPVWILGPADGGHYHVRADGYIVDHMHGRGADLVWGS